MKPFRNYYLLFILYSLLSKRANECERAPLSSASAAHPAAVGCIAVLTAKIASAAHIAAHAAATAHHLIGNLGDLLAVDVDGAAVELRRAVVIEGGIAVDADGAAVDDDIAVGVNAVGVACAHGDVDGAAVDLDGGGIGVGFLGGVDAVVPAGEVEGAVIDADIGAFNAFRRADGKLAAVNLDDGCSVNAVVSDAHGEAAPADIDVAESVVVIVFRVESVGSRLDGEGTVGNADGVVGFDRLGRGGDLVGAACDLEIVLADNAIVGRVDSERACAVQGEVVLGEDDAVGLGVAVSGEFACDGERIVAGQGDKYLVSVLDVNAGRVGIGDRHAVQHDLHLVLVARVHNDGAVFRAAGDVIDAGFGDGDVLAGLQRELLCLAEVGILRKVSLGE